MHRPALLALSFLAAPLAAQTPVPLDDALQTARTQAVAVLRADAAVEGARVAVDAAEARRWPSLDLRAGGGQRYGLAFDNTSGSLTQATIESVDIGVDAGYVVYDGGARGADARAAEAGLQAAVLDRERAEQRAAEAVVEGYRAVARADAARAVAAEALAAQRDLLAEVEAQVEVGERPGYEAAQQRERVAAAQGDVLAAERDRALAEARLVRVLGLDPAGDYAFPAPAPGAAPPAALVGDLVRQALSVRADVRAAEAAVVAAEADRRAARAGRLPTVAVGAYVGTNYSSAAGTALPGQLGDNRAGALRLTVSLPVLDRGAAGTAVRRAEARATALRADQEDVRRAVALDVRERSVEVDAAAARAEVAAVRVEAAEAALAAERARYAAGATTLQAVSLLQARLVEARTERAQLAVEAAFNRRLLALALGQ
ncbi:TolC family protein [Rubrivirga sp. S365]|uniref:TolC family protein n=1 Tax=Rubrivirga sp. S365 TaxID=3076080 RepID=UPI0028CAE3CE|nr:TolC family protein [Rubrivirga sp. S365]MDT7856754.1 TolC family protein [Rubrivirga sp. S365]